MWFYPDSYETLNEVCDASCLIPEGRWLVEAVECTTCLSNLVKRELSVLDAIGIGILLGPLTSQDRCCKACVSVYGSEHVG